MLKTPPRGRKCSRTIGATTRTCARRRLQRVRLHRSGLPCSRRRCRWRRFHSLRLPGNQTQISCIFPRVTANSAVYCMVGTRRAVTRLAGAGRAVCTRRAVHADGAVARVGLPREPSAHAAATPVRRRDPFCPSSNCGVLSETLIAEGKQTYESIAKIRS